MEVDSRLGRKFIIPRHFQLTTSRGGRQRWESTAEQVIFFNSRPLVEVDSWTSLHLFLAIFFNSRPLVEVDQLHCEHYTDGIFSTHDLSWRSTRQLYIIPHILSFFNSRPLVEIDFVVKKYIFRKNFSTHDLSWRSTIVKNLKQQVEDFSTHDLSWRSTFMPCTPVSPVIFNSRPLVEVDSQSQLYAYPHKIFRLTTSRGGRLHSVTMV